MQPVAARAVSSCLRPVDVSARSGRTRKQDARTILSEKQRVLPTSQQDARGDDDAKPEPSAELDRARRSNDATADRLALPPAHSFRARPARQRPPDTSTDSTHSRPDTTHAITHDISSSQQLPALDRHGDDLHQEPEQPDASRRTERPPSARTLPRRGNRAAREVGGCGRWEWVGRSRHLHGRSPRGLADSGRQVKAKSGLDPPTTARQDKSLPDRGDASPSARSVGGGPAGERRRSLNASTDRTSSDALATSPRPERYIRYLTTQSLPVRSAHGAVACTDDVAFTCHRYSWSNVEAVRPHGIAPNHTVLPSRCRQTASKAYSRTTLTSTYAPIRLSGFR